MTPQLDPQRESGNAARIDTEPESLGQAIHSARTALGLAQDDLARDVGVTGGAVSKWELGLSTPGRLNLARLEKALRLEPGALFAILGVAAPDPAPADPGLAETVAEIAKRLARVEQVLAEFLAHRGET